jgi:hypothetical protein
MNRFVDKEKMVFFREAILICVICKTSHVLLPNIAQHKGENVQRLLR